MSIVIITSPEAHRALDHVDGTLCGLWEQAQASGHDLTWCRCSDYAEVTRCLDQCCVQAPELVLLDLDAAAVPDDVLPRLRNALCRMHSPYIEAHDDTDASDASGLAPGHASLASVTVPGDSARSYAMALSIGLRYLGAVSRMAA
jgi:3-dehydroquinate dehydratase II